MDALALPAQSLELYTTSLLDYYSPMPWKQWSANSKNSYDAYNVKSEVIDHINWDGIRQCEDSNPLLWRTVEYQGQRFVVSASGRIKLEDYEGCDLYPKQYNVNKKQYTENAVYIGRKRYNTDIIRMLADW